MGRAAAILFASEGARVIGCDVNTESALETLRLVKASQGDMASMQPCDLTDAKQCQALVDFAVSTYGRIDVLFNNAAMAYFGWIDQMTDEDWYKTITQELHLVFLLTKAAWPELARHGGSIVNTASVSARDRRARHRPRPRPTLRPARLQARARSAGHRTRRPDAGHQSERGSPQTHGRALRHR